MISIFKKSVFEKLNNKCLFEYLIILTLIFLGMIGWKYSYSATSIIITSITLILVFIFNDFKYVIPAGLCLLFSYNGGYSYDRFPVEIVTSAAILLAIIIIHTVYNFKDIKTKKPKSFFGFLLMGISCIIPIFYNKVITEETRLMYIIYASWLLYTLMYFIFSYNSNKNTLKTVVISLSNLALLIFFETAVTVYNMHIKNPDSSIFSFNYSLGWGISNEAGIMLCFCIPFIFYEFIKSDKIYTTLFSIFKIVIAMLGILLTSSRLAVMFGLVEFISLTVVMIIFSREKIYKIAYLLLIILIGLLFMHAYFGLDKIIGDIFNVLFSDKFDDNGRFKLYSKAINLWNTNWLTRFFGSGIISELEYRYSYGVWNLVYTVYHSTFFQTLVFGGIFGVCGLLYHFYEKYKQLFKTEIVFGMTTLIGYLAVDLYGMLDNTYGMYYYMIPLIMLMSAIVNFKNNKNKKTTNYLLICINML